MGLHGPEREIIVEPMVRPTPAIPERDPVLPEREKVPVGPPEKEEDDD